MMLMSKCIIQSIDAAMATEERYVLCGKLVLAGEAQVLGATTSSRHVLDCLLHLRPSASEECVS